MSRRRIQAASAVGGGFSLRSNVPIESPGLSFPAHGDRSLSQLPSAHAQSAALSFKFDSLKTKPVAVAAAAAAAAAATHRRNSALFARTVRNTACSADVLRLTAVVDDLNLRLRKTQDAKIATETHVRNVEKLIAHERENSKSQLRSLAGELKIARADKLKLTGELSKRPVPKEVDEGQWTNRVQSAIEQDEARTRIADESAKLVDVMNRHELLSSEIDVLESRRAEAVSEIKGALSADEVEELVKKAAVASKHVESLGDAAAALEDSICRFTAMRDAHKIEAAEAEAELASSNQRTVKAIADEKALTEISADALSQKDELCDSVVLLKQELEDLRTIAKSPETFRISGDGVGSSPFRSARPKQRKPVNSALGDILSLSSVGIGLPSHFEQDCPICIAKLAPNSNENGPSDQMVSALISDLQVAFQDAADSFDKIGR